MEKFKEALFHDGTERFCKYNKKTGLYTIILRTEAMSVENAYIAINDSNTYMKMEYCKNIGEFDYYMVRLSLKEGEIIRYHFMAHNGHTKVYYNQNGAGDYVDPSADFEMTVGFRTPNWAKGAVMYQIMVDRFYNGDPTNDVFSDEYAYIGRGVDQIRDWYQMPAPDDVREFYGGDLQGVMDKMDYLKKIGVEVIYFNPLFVSPSNHKYDTQDYDHIDPHIGKIVYDSGELLKNGDLVNEHAERYKVRTTYKLNLEASDKLFAKLVKMAHERGIKVIIDGVFNHCGSFNKWLNREKLYKPENGYEKGAYEDKESPYVSYFKFFNENWPDNNHYDSWWGFDTLPKLNYEESRKLCEEIFRVARKWVSPPYNADGWRLDVAADLGQSLEFNHSFWKEFRDNVKAANPNAIILAEHYGDAHDWLLGDQWDTVMNYDGFMDPVGWFLTGVDKHSDNVRMELKGDGYAFHDAITFFNNRLQTESLLVAMNELSNHDHSRFMTRTNGRAGRVGTAGSESASDGINEGIFKQGVVMQMTLPGAPTVYYGDEVGLCGWTDPDNRRTFPWGRENFEIQEFYREAISIHKRFKCLKTGSFMMLGWGRDYVSYGRFDEKETVITAVNTSGDDITVSIPTWKCGMTDGQEMEKVMETWREFFNCGRTRIVQKDGHVEITIKAGRSMIYHSVNP